MSEDIEHINGENEENNLGNVIQVQNLYEGWFLDYASYVILERAVPHIHDGLKPVQRRILHSLWEMDDGRFHKVANVVGRTMSLHPHGDASIGAALVIPAASWWLYHNRGPLLPLFLTVLGLLIIIRHKTNIQRLLNGTESRFERKKKTTDPH